MRNPRRGDNLVVREAEVRAATRPEYRRSFVRLNGITEFQKNAMRQLFLEGKYSIGEVAKQVGVSYSKAKKAVEEDDDLREMWETSFQTKMDNVEEAMVERAVGGRNEIAAQQAGEFLLRHHRKQTYSDTAMPMDMLKALPKIIIAPVVTRSPIQPEAIDVKAE